ncbi:hypothetical protein PR202_ga21154 [Eleusine coracana subsp. coracana]|uniref:Protein kinase domain-containing protein n=1 Tax=Eleusine coracana subsp. coracana TaxID=191504 RepID=A0AAV5D0M6_ELECO|nr:hypothetical protein PR202_ga21154 [Eleusine coracana subsp. coracana]
MATASKEAVGRGEGKTAVAGNGDEFTMTSDGNAFPANFAEIVASLPQPQGPQSPMFPSLRLYHGFWLPEITLLSLPQIHARFNPGPTDVLVASFPKSGTTWLKSVCYAALRRSVHSPSGGGDSVSGGHPLLSRNSHDCVRSLDTLRFLQGSSDDAAAPHLVGTHLPYSLLPAHATGGGKPAGKKGTQPPEEAKFEEAFEQFCNGCYCLGPQWEHAREYWEASRRRPEKVLFLMYEEMLRDPAGSLRKIAAFIGCPFTAAEEEAGVVQDILELCSIEKQRSLAVNKDGAYVLKGVLRIGNNNFFRKGVAGDWRNHMTPEMAARLDGIVQEALEGTGLTFGDRAVTNSGISPPVHENGKKHRKLVSVMSKNGLARRMAWQPKLKPKKEPRNDRVAFDLRPQLLGLPRPPCPAAPAAPALPKRRRRLERLLASPPPPAMAGEEAPLGALNLSEYAPAGARTVDCYRRIRKIGEGTYGEVFEAVDIITGERAALKKIKLDDGKEGFPRQILREIKLLKKLDHENIIRLKEIVVSPGTAHGTGGSGANLLLSGGKLLKLADFGLARSFTDDGNFTNHVITLWYRPPELLLGATNYAEAVDIWSVGCIFAEFLLKKPLFPGRTERISAQDALGAAYFVN